MRAILIKNERGPIENLYLGETADPILGAGEVMVKIKAFGLNRMDIMQREGMYPIPPGASEILGVEFSGYISSIGEGVTEWNVNDEVLGLAAGGAYAELIAVPATHLIPKPQYLSWNEAASIPEVFLTAYQAIALYGEVAKGENVLIHAAASGVGIAAVQLARIKGAKNVVATASKKEKLDWLLSIANGATHGVNYKTQDFAREVGAITENKGVNVVVDFVGQSHWKKNIQSLARDGRMVMLATLSGFKVEEFDLREILYKRLRIQGSTLRSRSVEYQADLVKRFQSEILPNITGKDGNGTVKTYIHKIYSWKDIQSAHREMEGDNNIGKIICEVD
ncbi:quinone oxidoreductase [Moniliophthora roreri MCA 2997]|uniref:Quinone oxidoreductase n=2 Tax=Moniliophthora roreri TaxID=221103 RepID=V2XPN6_MONRO|nr:quinone oxidoreductase [Moniliophthora roreri MCA 2997]KAI3621238.1 quinone oxidoreductase [Moniliophthora roreri]